MVALRVSLNHQPERWRVANFRGQSAAAGKKFPVGNAEKENCGGLVEARELGQRAGEQWHIRRSPGKAMGLKGATGFTPGPSPGNQ